MEAQAPAMASGAAARRRSTGLRIALTAEGWLVLAAIPLLVSSLFWLDHPTGLYLGLALGLAFVLSHFWARSVVVQVRSRWLVPDRVHAGEETTVGSLLSSQRPCGPVHFLLPLEEQSELEELTRLPALSPTPTRIAWITRFPKRGPTELPRLQCECQRPFGLLAARSPIGDQAEVLVLPPLGKIKSEAGIALKRWLALGGGDDRRGEDELSQLRDYRPGDSQRQIHWRASARARKLLVAERHSPQLRYLAILIDHHSKGGRSRRFERLIAAVATIACHYVDQGWKVSLHGPWATPDGVRGDRYELLEALAVIEGSAEAMELLPPPTGPVVVFTLREGWSSSDPERVRVYDRLAAEDLVQLGRWVK